MRPFIGIVLAALTLPTSAHAAEPNAAQRAFERKLGPQAVVDIDAETGTPRVLARLDGTLSAPEPGAPEAVALRYVRANLAALGLTEADLDTLQAPETATAGGVTEVRWRQAVDGIAAVDRELRVNLTADGRVVNVLGSPASGLDPDTTARISAGEAINAVQDAVGVHRSLALAGNDAKPVLYRDRLTWRVTYTAASDAVYDAFVDAETGRVVKKANLVKSAAGDALVWERYPGAAVGGTAAPKNLTTLGYLTSTANLSGPNVRAFSDLNDNNAIDSGEEITSDAGEFDFPLTPFAHSSCNASHLCSWSGTGTTWTTNRRQNGVQAFYLANRFHDHLRAAPISFTDGAFEGADRLVLQTDDGVTTGPNSRHVNNANMMTPPDGGSPVMQMYVFRPNTFRAVNGGDDASIVYHEYTHGLSNRLITDASGMGAVNSAQAGAMGEGWGDWYAKDFIVGQFPSLDTATAGEIDMGDYIDLVAHAIRRQALDCPVSATAVAGCPSVVGPGGFTYGDFGKVNDEPEVHGDGEIWAQTLWDLRSAIGPTNARRLITQGMRLSPPEPSFLDMRNAILQADAAEGGARRTQIWTVFARRGMGFFATTDDSDDVTPTEDMSLPPSGGPRGRIAGTVTDAHTGEPVAGGRAAVGGLETGPDALVGTSGANGAFEIANVPPRAYPSVQFRAPGYDRLIAPVTVAANATTTRNVPLRRNWATPAGGSSVLGDSPFGALGCGPEAAVDQRAATGWSTHASSASTMVVTLPRAVDIDRFAIDPTEACGSDATSATSSFVVETSTGSEGGPWTPAATGTLASSARHRMNEVLPTAGAAGVRFVRVSLRANFGGPFRDLTEFAIYGRPTAPPPSPTPDPPASPPSQVPTAPPTTAQPLARPSFTLPSSGKRSVRFKVRCAADCRVTAKLVVSARVARRLGLGRSRTAGTLTRTVKGGTTTLTLKLSSKVRRRDFRGTLRVSAAYARTAAVSRSRSVAIKR